MRVRAPPLSLDRQTLRELFITCGTRRSILVPVTYPIESRLPCTWPYTECRLDRRKHYAVHWSARADQRKLASGGLRHRPWVAVHRGRTGSSPAVLVGRRRRKVLYKGQ